MKTTATALITQLVQAQRIDIALIDLELPMDDAGDAPHRQVPALADAYVVRLGELHPAAQRLERVFVQDALRALGLDALEHGDLLGELVGVEVLGVIVEPQLDADRRVELRLDDVFGRFVRAARSLEGVLRFDRLALDELEVGRCPLLFEPGQINFHCHI